MVTQTKEASKSVATPMPQTETPPAGQKLMMKLAVKYGVDENKMLATLKATAFRQRDKKVDGKIIPAPEISNEQMMMLAVVADQYGLNPFTREIYAFPSENGIVAVISVDGWIRIINERPELDSIAFDVAEPGTDDPWISCTIKRKDRSLPLTVTEYLSECSRNTEPWKDMPRRMLRHKALIQCARIAFGFAGVYDPDEADRIVSTVEQRQAALTNGKPESNAPKRLSEETPSATPRTPVDRASCISFDQATEIADRLREEGVKASALLAKFEIGTIEDIPADQYRRAIELINLISQGKDADDASAR